MGRGTSKANGGSANVKYPPTKANEYIQKRFPDMNAHEISNNYWSMDRVSKNEDRVVVRVAEEHLIKTQYGYALVLDDKHVVFTKDNYVSQNYFGNEVMLNKQYFNVKEWGNHSNFSENPQNLKWETWLNTAKEQAKADKKEGRSVRWEKTGREKTVQSFQKQAEKKKKK